MKYDKYEEALSKPRLAKYQSACNGNKSKALTLYWYNIKLCQRFYGVLSIFEIVMRNAINEHYKNKLSDNDWIVTQSTKGFLVNKQDAVFKEKDKLLNSGTYTHDKLVSSLSFGVWTFLFSRNCYKNSGKTLLQIFPNKISGMNQSDFYKDMDSIRLFRNRIAHHEPLCFNANREIHVDYAENIYNLTIQYIQFMGYKAEDIFLGVEKPTSIIKKIKELKASI